MSNSTGDVLYNKYTLSKLTIENTTGTFKAAEKPLLDELVSYDGADSTNLENGVTATYDSGTHETTFTFPHGGRVDAQVDDIPLEGMKAHMKNPDGSVGELLPILSRTSTSHLSTATYEGDLTLLSIWFGREYRMKYEYSSPILKGPSIGGGSSELLAGRYQINSADIAYHNTGNFDISVDTPNGFTYSYAQNAIPSGTHEVAGVRVPPVSDTDRLDLIDVYDYSGYRIRFQVQTGKLDNHTDDASPNYHLTGSAYQPENGPLHVYVNIYGMTDSGQIAAEFVKAINARTDLKVTARQCGVDIPFTSGELPLSHEDRDEAVGSQAGVARTFILIQDVAGTAASTLTDGGLRIGGLSPDNDPYEFVGWAFGVTDGFADRENPMPLPLLDIDEPTLAMTFMVSTSPFVGREGQFVTSRNILDRLMKEVEHNVSMRVEATDSPDAFTVKGRGELQLSILIENMRREGFELQVAKPQVIMKDIDGVMCEPIELAIIDVADEFTGVVIEKLGLRKGEMISSPITQTKSLIILINFLYDIL
jgi:hypothetical protein